MLGEQGVTRFDVVNYISHGVSKTGRTTAAARRSGARDRGPASERRRPGREGSRSRAYTMNLNKEAAEGRIDPLVGRENEVARTIQVLARRRKNNPLLIGDAGVGKTAIVEGLAQKIAQGDVPAPLEGRDGLRARHGRAARRHASYRGDFENRLKAVHPGAREAAGRRAVHRRDPHDHRRGRRQRRDDGRVQPAQARARVGPAALHRGDHVPGVPRATSSATARSRAASSGSRSASPSVDETTADPPGPAEALRGVPQGHVHEPRRSRPRPSSRRATCRTGRLPDKAIDLLDEAGAAARLAHGDGYASTSADIELVVAKMAQIPPRQVSTSDKAQLKDLDESLRGR